MHHKLQELRKTVPLCHVAWPKFNTPTGTVQQKTDPRPTWKKHSTFNNAPPPFFPGPKTTSSNADIASTQSPLNPTPEFEDINSTLDNWTGNQDKGDLGTMAPSVTSKIKHMPLTKSYPSIPKKMRFTPNNIHKIDHFEVDWVVTRPLVSDDNPVPTVGTAL